MIHVFIINPYAGRRNFSVEIRERIKKLNRSDFFTFNTRNAGYESVLVKKMLYLFPEERIRFYCCGGSGTFRNMISAVDDKDRVEFAHYPCGATNDFIKSFGDNERHFRDITNLIDGTPVKIDYIHTNYGDAINTVSTGMDANVVKTSNNLAFFNSIYPGIPYILGLLYTIFISKPREYICTVDGNARTQSIPQFILGNGIVFGDFMYFDDVTNIVDGKAQALVSSHSSMLKLVRSITRMKKNTIDELARDKNVELIKCSCADIEMLDGAPMSINFDGDVVTGINKLHMEVVQKGLTYVIPKGVSINE